MDISEVRTRVVCKLVSYRQARDEIKRIQTYIDDLDDSIRSIESEARYLDGLTQHLFFSRATDSSAGTRHPKGHVSDKTYSCIEIKENEIEKWENVKREHLERMNGLKIGCDRLERYISALNADQANILRKLYIEGVTIKVLAAKKSFDRRTIERHRDEAEDMLASMYKPLYDVVELRKKAALQESEDAQQE